jgi:hypothetical protein
LSPSSGAVPSWHKELKFILFLFVISSASFLFVPAIFLLKYPASKIYISSLFFDATAYPFYIRVLLALPTAWLHTASFSASIIMVLIGITPIYAIIAILPELK